MKRETRESVAEKIKALRAGVAKDRASKLEGRKSGQATEVEDKPASTRAGGEAVVPTEIPAEFGIVDFTTAEEELREALKGPDACWLETVDNPQNVLEAAKGDSAPQQAKDLVAKAEGMPSSGSPARGVG